MKSSLDISIKMCVIFIKAGEGETVHGYWMKAGEGETVYGYWMKAGEGETVHGYLMKGRCKLT